MDGPLDRSRQVRQVSDIIGEWGRWQANIAACCISIAIFSAFNNLASAFYAPNVDYYCQDDAPLNSVSKLLFTAEYCAATHKL